MRGIALALVAGFLLAGCAQDTSSSASNSLAAQLSDVPATASNGLACIRGVVVDEGIRPVGNATITFTPSNKTVKADGQGRFSACDLKPGTYFLRASAPGFFPQQSSTEVGPDAVTDVRIALAADRSPQPYHQTIPFKGFIQASAGIVSYAVDLFANQTGVSTCTCTLYFQVDDRVKTIVYEAQWTTNPDNPVAPAQFYWEVESSSSTDAGDIQSAYANSPILATMKPSDIGNFTGLQARLTGPAEWVTYNQPYDMYVTLFYNEPAPKDWSFIKGSK